MIETVNVRDTGDRTVTTQLKTMARRGAGLSVMLVAVLAISLGLAAAALAAPAPLSADHSSPPISSAFGSGSFGKWTVDSFGLPAYDYTIDQATNPIAAQPELNGSTDAWSQIGNDHIVADAFNHGYVQLWSQDRLYQWMNYYDASHEHYAGGFGYINVGGKVISTLYDDRPAGAGTERVFGVGYQAKQTSVPGLSESDTVYAPFGDASLLLHDVTITNTELDDTVGLLLRVLGRQPADPGRHPDPPWLPIAGL